MKEHAPVENYVVVNDEIIQVSENAIDLSKCLSKLAKMVE